MTRINLTDGSAKDYIDVEVVEDSDDATLKAKIATVTVHGMVIFEKYSFAYNESDENVQIAVESDLLEKGYTW